MTTERRLRAWVRLSLCRSVGARTWNHWLIEIEAAGLTLEDFLDLAEYEARPFLANWPQIAHALRHETPPSFVLDQIHARLDREKTRLVPINDPHYPARLLTDLGLDAPTFLCVSGRLNHLHAPTMAMVGTRSPSPLGEASARAYANALAHRGVHIISGQARGIDVAAHEGALSGGGSTTLVLPCGFFSFEMSPHLRQLATPDNTLILSQFPPDAPTTRYSPTVRNTIVAALADGLIVAETRLMGGPSYTFREARHMQKPLWTVIYPEPVPPSASGNHSLLSAGAEPLEPGEAGAEKCVSGVVHRLREAHARRPAPTPWPPRDNPGQGELF
jgi:DNA processing protein